MLFSPIASSSFAPRASLLPGIALSVAFGLIAVGAGEVERVVFGHVWLEALVVAILIGALWRSLLPESARTAPGIAWSAKFPLELAVALLGASIDVDAVASAGPALLAVVAGLVVVSLALSYGLGRLLGLDSRTAILVAGGNSICGNSAIVAIAPVIGATPKQVGSAIAFTAVLGIAAVLVLPFVGTAIGLAAAPYGVFAGLTVYAVPQVIAATAPVAAISLQWGTLTKLLRVLMLGPVVFGLALANRGGGTTRLHQMVPWFIVGFAVMLAARAIGVVPAAALPGIGIAANILAIISMAALGLSVDLRTLATAGGRVAAAATLSLLLLCGLAYAAVQIFGLPG